MSSDNDRLREFVSNPIDLENFLEESVRLKNRINSFRNSTKFSENELKSLVDIGRSLGDYREFEENRTEEEEEERAPVDEDEEEPIEEENWRTKRKKTKIDPSIMSRLKTYPASIEYLYREFSQSRPHASHDTAFLKNIRQANQLAPNFSDERFVLNLQIFFPIESRDRYRHQLMNELICLSTTSLAEIRDAIECVSDEQILGEFSQNPQLIETEGKRAGDVNTAAAFIIDSTIYDDVRRTDQRLSQTILENTDIQFQQGKPVEQMRLIDLKSIQLGKPYIYLHQNNCEHVIVFSELKLIEPDQCHDQT